MTGILTMLLFSQQGTQQIKDTIFLLEFLSCDVKFRINFRLNNYIDESHVLVHKDCKP